MTGRSAGSWRLLILSCSARKRGDGDLLPAVERYDGPAFRLFRKYRRAPTPELGAGAVRAYILSAEFGLVGEDALVPPYDRLMTTDRGRELRPAVAAAMRALLAGEPPVDALLCGGRRYLDVLNEAAALLAGHSAVAAAHNAPAGGGV